MLTEPANFQTLFQQRWPHLQQADVRNLAWLLDSPILLNANHPRWANRLAQLPPMNPEVAAWLTELDRAPQVLQKFLAVHPHTRLGHYAENLLAFYFQWRGELVAHSVQVRSHTTIGEFDFLLNTPRGLEHWEFACKFYLLVEPASQLADFVGPNLMDNLNDKSHKIMDMQLALGQHQEAQRYLPSPLRAARALLKGWLFYHAKQSGSLPEIESKHCRGSWCRLSESDLVLGEQFCVLTRLRWLAPTKVQPETAISRGQLFQMLAQQFETDQRPVLVARLTACDADLVESARFFVVPDGWMGK